MEKKAQGFTIVELLIVIVVIAILAAISIVAYTGIQQRATNTKTEQAVAQWVKILHTYKAIQGAFPATSSCLGAENSYNSLGCRQDTAGGGIITRDNAFYTAIQTVIGTSGSWPTPSMVRQGNGNPYYIGAYWLSVVSPQRIDYVLQGADSACGSIGGARLLTSSPNMATNTRQCLLVLE